MSTTLTPTQERRPYRRGEVRTRRSRLGTKQQVSVRGRRIETQQSANPMKRRFLVGIVASFIAGIIGVMWLSGVTTQQSFHIQQAKAQNMTLMNELETLQRDVQMAQSGSHLAAEAARLGMVVPEQPGVLNVAGEQIEEHRGTDPAKTRGVVDINGNVTARSATSDPALTRQVEGLAPAEAVVADAAGVAPAAVAPVPEAAQASESMPVPAPALVAPPQGSANSVLSENAANSSEAALNPNVSNTSDEVAP